MQITFDKNRVMAMHEKHLVRRVADHLSPRSFDSIPRALPSQYNVTHRINVSW